MLVDHPYFKQNVRIVIQSRKIALSFNAMEVYDITEPVKGTTCITIRGKEGKLFNRYTHNRLREVERLVRRAKQLVRNGVKLAEVKHESD